MEVAALIRQTPSKEGLEHMQSTVLYLRSRKEVILHECRERKDFVKRKGFCNIEDYFISRITRSFKSKQKQEERAITMGLCGQTVRKSHDREN